MKKFLISAKPPWVLKNSRDYGADQREFERGVIANVEKKHLTEFYIFVLFRSGGEQILLYRLLLFRIFDVFCTNFLSESTYKDTQSREKLCF